MQLDCDIAIAGGGPAGLAAAVCAARAGLSAVVLERAFTPRDKACGEGLMPGGLAALERMGVLPHLDLRESAPYVGIRYVQEDGTQVEGRLPGGGGLGIRRLALSDALSARARELGVRLQERAQVTAHRRVPGGIEVDTAAGTLRARLLVAADGLASPLRHAEGLDVPVHGPRRFGLRRHFARPAWSPFVEVHFADGVEAYVTPAGTSRVGVAFLWEDGAAQKVSFESLLARFPVLQEQLAGTAPDSEARGAGPLARRARSRVADRFVLLGDAAGYVDACTGEGLSLAFTCAEALGQVLPGALAQGADARALAPYERAFRRAFRSYAWTAGALLFLARRPRARRAVIRSLSRHPQLFERLLRLAVV
ncbi:FAD-binding protein [Aggregicoccus sp. 17bor-14]|uniref:NAD(P)/FAD-dependent oxidoreductase n=1 Tax=Myxococcaceae TaxID=31 RepID=UPI00129C2DB9|nr:MULTISPECIES: FAD-dependent monooxygenase [Myxococcaceae]MBF5041804.1 FAD-dependent monooxygenase [Simulacricoccus sp. 17bor-14]MRI87585.1 FAD-binding protein [Aggregicoccus sp. 17bor-14]